MCRAFVNAVMDLRFPLNTSNSLTTWHNVRFSRRIMFHGVLLVDFTAFRKAALTDRRLAVNRLQIKTNYGNININKWEKL